ncbi:MAG: FecR domain-containing protein [Bdellovibrionia bacterium]
MDRRLIAGALLLLILEVSWLLNDLKIIDVPIFNQHEKLSSERPIGRVLSTKQDLRRRSADSILWEESRTDDTLFFYDSVLTLDQSAATIQLNDTSELSLSENTLVVLEPVENTASDVLRVKFSHGQLHSRNLASDTVITAPEWTMQVSKGADVKLRTVSGDQMEVELLKGKVQLKSKLETVSFDDEQVIMLHKEQAEAMPISQKFGWESGKNNIYRVYAHSFPAMTWLRWKGEATRLRLTKPGNDQSVFPITTDQTQFPLRLEPGLYQVRVENGKDTSPTLAVQVWKAPGFHLLSPLPRDRFTVGTEALFTWSTAGLISKYRFELGRDENFTDVVRAVASEKSHTSLEMPEKGQYYWRVQALDDLDFPIPSLDTNVIFSVKDPLQAPKLRVPETRAPAKDETSWNWKSLLDSVANFILPKAEAREEFFEAVFSWEAVEDADHYYIEIDVKPDFHSPILVQKTKSPQFVWPKANVGVYFWRVAAGSEERMGLFSEAAQVKLQTPPKNHPKEVAPGVQVRRLKPLSEPIPEAPKVMALETPEPSPTPEPPMVDRPTHFSVTYGVGYDYSLLTAEDSANANFSGVTPLRLGFGLELPVGREASVWTDFLYHRSIWKPKSTSEVPFQSQIIDTGLRAHVHYRAREGAMHVGFYGASTAALKRDGLESVSLNNVVVIGPAFGVDWLEFEKIAFTHLVSVGVGSGMVELATVHRGVRRLYLNDRSSLLLSGEMDLTLQRHNNGTNYRVQFGISAGVEW